MKPVRATAGSGGGGSVLKMEMEGPLLRTAHLAPHDPGAVDGGADLRLALMSLSRFPLSHFPRGGGREWFRI